MPASSVELASTSSLAESPQPLATRATRATDARARERFCKAVPQATPAGFKTRNFIVHLYVRETITDHLRGVASAPIGRPAEIHATSIFRPSHSGFACMLRGRANTPTGCMERGPYAAISLVRLGNRAGDSARGGPSSPKRVPLRALAAAHIVLESVVVARR